MSIRLSHSAMEKYTTCSMLYKLHYKDRLRGTTLSSPLLFGSAIDTAINILLLSKKGNPTESELEELVQDPKEVFKTLMEHCQINGEAISTPTSVLIEYYKSDCDPSLLEKEDIHNIKTEALKYDIEIEDVTLFIKEVQKLTNLEEDIKRIYNYICWTSLYRKGLMLIDGFKEQVFPKIHEVFEIQKKVTLDEGDDTLIGYIDFIGSFVDDPDKKYVCDIKTSSQKYPDDSVQNSQQLSIYAEHEDIYNCAYIVLEKKIRKRDPRVRTQIIKDTIKDENIDKIFDKITDVLYGIKDEEYVKNFDNCFQYGRKCVYWDYCRSGKKDGLKET